MKRENSSETGRLDRRAAIKWMLATAATFPVLDKSVFAQSGPSVPTPNGIGSDPNLLAPGELPWELTLTEEQRETLTALTDLILPKVGDSPSASELHVPDFIDEWISAPYPRQKDDRRHVLNGLNWLDAESKKRFSKSFRELAVAERTEIGDEINYLPKAKSEYKKGAEYFAKIRDLTMAGYYTTDAGAREVGYVGNVALPSFDGPPKEVLDQLGVDQAPW